MSGSLLERPKAMTSPIVACIALMAAAQRRGERGMPDAARPHWNQLSREDKVRVQAALTHAREGELNPASVRTGPRRFQHPLFPEPLAWPASLISIQPHPLHRDFVLAKIIGHADPYREDGLTACAGEYGAICTAEHRGGGLCPSCARELTKAEFAIAVAAGNCSACGPGIDGAEYLAEDGGDL
jgi:hypothetical protein